MCWRGKRTCNINSSVCSCSCFHGNGGALLINAGGREGRVGKGEMQCLFLTPDGSTTSPEAGALLSVAIKMNTSCNEEIIVILFLSLGNSTRF